MSGSRGLRVSLGALLLWASFFDAVRDCVYGQGCWTYHLVKWGGWYPPLVALLWWGWPLWDRSMSGRRWMPWNLAIWVALAVAAKIAWKVGAIAGGQPEWGGLW